MTRADSPRPSRAKKQPLTGTVTKRGEKPPPILDDSVRARLVEALLAGAYVENAVVYAGVSRSQFYHWMNAGREVRERMVIDPEYQPVGLEAQHLEILDAVEQSQASAEVAAIGVIRRAMKEGTWQAAAWWLERTRPRQWGRFRDDGPAATGSGGDVHVSLEELEDAVQQVIAQRGKQAG